LSKKLVAFCRGRFSDNDPKYEISPNLPLGFLEMFYLWRIKPKIPNV